MKKIGLPDSDLSDLDIYAKVTQTPECDIKVCLHVSSSAEPESFELNMSIEQARYISELLALTLNQIDLANNPVGPVH